MVLALLLALRALVPAGFMASATDAGFQLVFCDGATTAAPMAGHHHAHHHPQGGSADPACPYAQSSGPAPLPSLPIVATDVRFAPVVERVTIASVVVAQGPPRQQSPRGPPDLA